MKPLLLPLVVMVCFFVGFYIVLSLFSMHDNPDMFSPIPLTTQQSAAPPLLICPPKSPRLNSTAIQFIHIPKAGGTSLQLTLTQWARKHKVPVVLKNNGPSDYEVETNDTSLFRNGLFLGHRGLGFSPRVNQHGPFTIVILRDPLDRVISTYNYIMQNMDLSIPAFYSWKDKTLDDIVLEYTQKQSTLASRALHRILRLQVQYLCGFDCVWPMPDYNVKTNEPEGFPAYDKMLTRALDNLEKRVNIVATLEDIGGLLNQFRLARLPVLYPPPGFTAFPKENVMASHKKQFVKESTKIALRNLLEKEYVLFTRAKQLSRERTQWAQTCLKQHT